MRFRISFIREAGFPGFQMLGLTFSGGHLVQSGSLSFFACTACSADPTISEKPLFKAAATFLCFAVFQTKRAI